MTSTALREFPCEDLQIIDQLWVKLSGGKFGFSVQKQIYVETGNPLDGKYHQETWEKFCDRIGWRKGDNYLSYDDLKAHLSLSPSGEFPCLGFSLSIDNIARCGLFSRGATCKL